MHCKTDTRTYRYTPEYVLFSTLHRRWNASMTPLYNTGTHYTWSVGTVDCVTANCTRGRGRREREGVPQLHRVEKALPASGTIIGTCCWPRECWMETFKEGHPWCSSRNNLRSIHIYSVIGGHSKEWKTIPILKEKLKGSHWKYSLYKYIGPHMNAKYAYKLIDDR